MPDVLSREFLSHLGEAVCSFEPAFYVAFVLEVAFLVILLFSLAWISPASESFPILVLDFVLLGATMSVTVYTLWRCRRI